MTKEQIEKMVLETFEARVNKMVEAALAERETEILELLSAKPRHRGFLSKLIEKGKEPVDGN